MVCDTDGALCNFWRAIRSDPEEVAHWADYPTIHQDLTARHRWLIQWTIDHGPKLSEDPDYFDAQAAGWWVWGISLWIGPGWCQTAPDWMPHPNHTGGGQGVSVQRTGRPHMHNSSATGSGVSAQKQFARDQVPVIQTFPGARGVSAQSSGKRPRVPDKRGGRGVASQRASRDQIPHTSSQYSGHAVTAQNVKARESMPRSNDQYSGHPVSAQSKTRTDLVDWFDRIAARLKGVIVLNRGWESAVTPTVLMQTPSGPKPPVGILLDPPYLTEERSKIYGSDMVLGESNRVARASYEWALAHGGRYRIAYCCHENDFLVPDGWTFETNTFGGIKDVKRFAERRDLVMFSPACVQDRQATLW